MKKSQQRQLQKGLPLRTVSAISMFNFLLSPLLSQDCPHISPYTPSPELELTLETQKVTSMVSNVESTGKPNLMGSTDTNLTAHKTMQITNQVADQPFSKSAADTAPSAKNLQVGPFAISNNVSTSRKSSESTFRTGKFLFVVDYILISTNVYEILKAQLHSISSVTVRTLTVITSDPVNSHCSIKLGIHDRTPATS